MLFWWHKHNTQTAHKQHAGVCVWRGGVEQRSPGREVASQPPLYRLKTILRKRGGRKRGGCGERGRGEGGEKGRAGWVCVWPADATNLF